MMKTNFQIVFLLITLSCFSQEPSIGEKNISIDAFIDGTLLLPNAIENPVLAIIISDYGPTDRNGNQNFSKHNSLKKLATSLTNNGIATFRYDKRTSKQLKTGQLNPDTLFDDFVLDAKSVLSFFKAQNYFSKLYIIGHGQGSLVGMLAINPSVSGFISISGSGKNIGDVIIEQINATARQYIDDTKKVVKQLKAGKTTTDFPKALSSMFNIETQPFMISWMAHTPSEVIQSINLPILIINGDKDLQVPVEEAHLLAQANTQTTLQIIKNMNHVLFTIEGDNLENSKSYNESFRPINEELMSSIIEFLNHN